jgi:hypothetical protein
MEDTIQSVNQILDEEQKPMRTVQVSHTDEHANVQFSLDVSRREHEALMRRLRQASALQTVQWLGTAEYE